MDKERAKLAIKHLIDRYNDNKHLKDFVGNEKQISRSLIEPFLRDVLGWDIEDPSEVKVEVPASGKRVDILVCLNGITQFIVEAKSLAQDIVDNNDFYKQTISYAHSKEKTFAILTNFKHLIILRCDVEVDNPLKAAVKIINIENYTDGDFDLIYNFSKEVWVEKGEENPLYLKLANYRRRIKVDIQLLEDLKEWRQSVINNIKKHPRHNKYDFSNEKEKYYVEEEIQRLIDRLIFVCYTEDKGFADPELKSLIEQKKDRYAESPQWLLGKIRELFKKYWNGYNSDLFKLGECDKFFIEDGAILNILTDLRKPKDRLPYDFASIEADILGKTYENFIGHVISGEKRLKEKESKGKRKSEGIYYTPTYIVDYIVRNTVKEYIKGKSIASINKVKILDPACGSGSFLIKAFDALVEENKNILKRELNYEEKKNLMLNCIHGVDKDERAVDICKLNLSLKLAERGQKLPELHNNIKCGDSLIDDENIAGYKAFKWENEFKEIMDNGGFDVVIGNPPYIPIELFKDNFKQYYFKKYSSPYRKFDTVILFIEKSTNLLKNFGLISFIVPQTWQTGENYAKFREFILSKCDLKALINLPFDIFEDAYIDTGIFILRKGKVKNSKFFAYSYNKKLKLQKIDDSNFQQIEQKLIEAESNKKVFSKKSTYLTFKKLKEDTIKLGEITDSCQGVVVSKFPIKKSKMNENYKKLLTSGIADRYYFHINEMKYIDYSKAMNLYKYYSISRIFIRRIVNRQNRLMAFFYEEPLIAKKDYNPFIIINDNYNIKYLLALINSKLLSYIYINMSALALKDDFRQTTLAELRQLPIKIISPDKQAPFIKLADKMLSLSKKLQEIGDKNTLEKQKLQEEIKKTDNEIDELVYQLYGITEEEKKIIEESLR